MKTPKQFNQLPVNEDAVMKAQANTVNLQNEMEQHKFTHNHGGIYVLISGIGRIHDINVDSRLIDGDHVPELIDQISAACGAAFDASVEVLNKKLHEIETKMKREVRSGPNKV